MNYKFWMVLVDGTNSTARRHTEEQSAKTEAARLAAETRKPVYVLEAVGVVALPEPAVEWKNLQHAPIVEPAAAYTPGETVTQSA